MIRTLPEPESGSPGAAGGLAGRDDGRSVIVPVPLAASTSQPVVVQRSEPSARAATGTAAPEKARASVATSNPSARTRTSVPSVSSRAIGPSPTSRPP